MSIALETPPQLHRAEDRKLRVLLVTQASGGGVGRHFLDLAQELTAQNVDVTGIYAPRKVDALFRKRLAAGGMPPMHILPMRRAIHPLDFVDLNKMTNLIRQLGPFDVIHAHSSKGGALGRLAANRLGIPTVYTSHAIVTLDPTLRPLVRNIYARIECWLAKKTGAIIAVSEDEAEHIRGLGISPNIVHVVKNGIECPDFTDKQAVRAKLGIQPDDVVIGFVGRMSPQKAPEILLEAYAKQFADRPNVKVLMVGSGPLDAEVRERVKTLGLESRVILLGDVVALEYMSAFDLFCLPSRYEGMPYVYLEALAAGLPVVSTIVGGATTCVEPDRTGLLVPVEDTVALGTALAKIVNDASLRQQFSAAAREEAKQFTAQQMVYDTLKIYDQVITNHAARNTRARSHA